MGGDLCRLCKREAELRYSHILPEFLYSPLYDELHRTMLVSSNQKEKFIQKGVREYLLCQECETKLSRYEGYAVKVIQNIPNFGEDSSGYFVFSDNIDYNLFKLFQLSILWRGSVSSNQMFANVNLGKHEEKIRVMLDQENPGKTSNYGCFMVRIPEPQKIHRIIMPPMPEKQFGHNGYRFMTGNLFWYFIVSSHTIQETVKPLLLQETGILRVWTAPWSEQEVYANIGKLFRSRKIK
ncbi:MAG: hypothetical protein H7Y59_07450 [Anaerolineales bacterium]|nr:hypothetical protein [Anaerolineales bacterium]